MKTKSIAMLMIIVGAILLSGCIELKQERTYLFQDNSKIVLQSDGNYRWISSPKHDGYVFLGKYQETDEEILIIMQPPLPSVPFKKQDGGKTITFKKDSGVLQ